MVRCLPEGGGVASPARMNENLIKSRIWVSGLQSRLGVLGRAVPRATCHEGSPSFQTYNRSGASHWCYCHQEGRCCSTSRQPLAASSMTPPPLNLIQSGRQTLLRSSRRSTTLFQSAGIKASTWAALPRRDEEEVGGGEDAAQQRRGRKRTERVWEDLDDEGIAVPIAEKGRLRKLRQSEDEVVLSGASRPCGRSPRRPARMPGKQRAAYRGGRRGALPCALEGPAGTLGAAPCRKRADQCLPPGGGGILTSWGQLWSDAKNVGKEDGAG